MSGLRPIRKNNTWCLYQITDESLIEGLRKNGIEGDIEEYKREICNSNNNVRYIRGMDFYERCVVDYGLDVMNFVGKIILPKNANLDSLERVLLDDYKDYLDWGYFDIDYTRPNDADENVIAFNPTTDMMLGEYEIATAMRYHFYNKHKDGELEEIKKKIREDADNAEYL